ncbi:hypothetical protein SODALDRAFT_271197 [Sodiomyces alkalinus F11]|uniref:60S ribosomal protein L20 n=1 Tax=Sodiomyces alkalinus (strain CBS 110278 / VKM F-3762 / F11) TaxID=1314773 RepID=A0A3N2Q3U2_SODAK|nr:hypothetical protein SODALDRAFT_271197 [Sodiomyces alkalinus F11]ROT41429.1 hypothetical protein SODALDRAFT_271197 [Sodiomyces alkalinus F11]
MEARALARPAASFLANLSAHGTTVTRRSHQTFSRTKRALNIAPHPAFTTSPAGNSNTIIFNPPAAEPSVHHTPQKFLPKSDPRRKHADLAALFASPYAAPGTVPSSSSTTTTTTTADADAGLPPALDFPSRNNPRYHLTREDVAEIRRLRAEDPARWSVNRLAKKFDCSEVFITICTPAPRDHKENLERKLEAVKRRWGAIRTKARVERAKRKDMLFRGEL